MMMPPAVLLARLVTVPLLLVASAPAGAAGPGKDAPLLPHAAAQPAAPGKVRPVFVDRGRIRVPGRKGRFVPDAKLVGAQLVGHDDFGRPVEFRIDSVLPPRAGDSLPAYVFSSRDSVGAWAPACAPDAWGSRRGFALPGRFDAAGRFVPDSLAFSLGCSAGASGKCLLSGYLPWGRLRDGRSLSPYFQACTRLIRADYCGNGKSHTRDGTPIEVWDHVGLERDTRTPGLAFEASWGADGAIWIRKTRLPDVASLEDIARECPERYARMRVPSDTSPKGPALLLNRSR